MSKKENILSLKENDPNLSNTQISKKIGTSRRYVRRVLAKYYKPEESSELNDMNNISEEEFYKLSLMTGFRKKSIPIKQRRQLAELVMSVEDSLQRIPKVDVEKSHTKKESSVLLVSDPHAGKLVYDDSGTCLYNKDICAFRLSLLKERVKKLLTEHLRLKNIDEFVICLLGDLVDGSGIYENQILNQDLSCWNDQLAVAVAGIWDLIIGIRKLGLPVKVYGVPGNHGRQGLFLPIQNNLDYIVLQMLYMLAQYEDKKVSVAYSTTTPYLNINVKGYKMHLRHQAPPQTETPSAKAKFGGWKFIHDWDVLCYGHLHHPSNSSFMNTDTFMNGSFIGMDDLSEQMSTFSRPSQTLFGVSSNIGVSFRYNIYLDKFGKGKEAERLLKRYPNLGG